MPSFSNTPMTPSSVPLATINTHFSGTQPQQTPCLQTSLVADKQLVQSHHQPLMTRSEPCFRVRKPVHSSNNNCLSQNRTPFPSDTQSYPKPLHQHLAPPPTWISGMSRHQGTRTASKPCFRIQNVMNCNNHLHSQNSESFSSDIISRQPPLCQHLVQSKTQHPPKPRNQTFETRSNPCFPAVTNYNNHNRSHLQNSVALSLKTQSHRVPSHQPLAPTLTWLSPESHNQGTMTTSKPCCQNIANGNTTTLSPTSTIFLPDTVPTSTNRTACILEQILVQQRKILSQQKAQIKRLNLELSQQQAHYAQLEQDNTSTATLAKITLLCNDIINKLASQPTSPTSSIATIPKVPEDLHYQHNPPHSTITATAPTKGPILPTFTSILMEANSFATYNTTFSFSSQMLFTLVPWYPPCLSLLVWIAHVDRIFIRHRKEIHQDTAL